METPLQHALATIENKSSLPFFWARGSNKKKHLVYKTDNNGKIGSSLKHCKIDFCQKRLMWTTTALYDFILWELLAACFFFFYTLFAIQCSIPRVLTGWLLSCYFSYYWQVNVPVLYNLTSPCHQPHLVGHVFPASWLESVPQSVAHFLISGSTFLLVEKVQEGDISSTLCFICTRVCDQASKIRLWTQHQFLEVMSFFLTLVVALLGFLGDCLPHFSGISVIQGNSSEVNGII